MTLERSCAKGFKVCNTLGITSAKIARLYFTARSVGLSSTILAAHVAITTLASEPDSPVEISMTVLRTDRDARVKAGLGITRLTPTISLKANQLRSYRLAWRSPLSKYMRLSLRLMQQGSVKILCVEGRVPTLGDHSVVWSIGGDDPDWTSKAYPLTVSIAVPLLPNCGKGTNASVTNNSYCSPPYTRTGCNKLVLYIGVLGSYGGVSALALSAAEAVNKSASTGAA